MMNSPVTVLLMLDKLVAPLKAYAPIVTTEGIVKVGKLVAPLKAYAPILVTFVPIITSVSASVPAKV